jgi:hypothetical protein
MTSEQYVKAVSKFICSGMPIQVAIWRLEALGYVSLISSQMAYPHPICINN